MNDHRLEGGHAPPPETQRVTSAGDPELQVVWDAPINPQDVSLDPLVDEAGPSDQHDTTDALLTRFKTRLREHSTIALLAAGLIGLALGALAAPSRPVLYLTPRR